jgi:hypothetical protein
MHTALMRESRMTDIRLVFVRRQVGNLGYKMGKVIQFSQFFLAKAFITQLELQVWNDRTQVGIAAALPLSVDGALHLGAARLNGCQRIGNRAFAIIVSMDTQRDIQVLMHTADDLTYLVR